MPLRSYWMHRAGTTPSVCVHIAAWRRTPGTPAHCDHSAKPYREFSAIAPDRFGRSYDFPGTESCEIRHVQVNVRFCGLSSMNFSFLSPSSSRIVKRWNFVCVSSFSISIRLRRRPLRSQRIHRAGGRAPGSTTPDMLKSAGKTSRRDCHRRDCRMIQ